MSIHTALETIAAEAAGNELMFTSHTRIVQRVRDALNDPDCSIDQLSKLISAEPILSAKVVSIANSAAYNPSGRSMSDVRSAIARLGFNTLRTVATAMVVRQMHGMPRSPKHRALANRLWEHTAHVAALARVLARQITHQDPEAAFFAGIVHEAGAFYLLSRVEDFPDLLECDLIEWHESIEAKIGRIVLRALDIPENVQEAVETLWNGYLAMPATSLGDTLLLADQLAQVESPLAEMSGMGHNGLTADIDLIVDGKTMSDILSASAEEVVSLTTALNL